ncbi:MAG: hypothetical protein Q9191_007538 [Dirinaria sp. TL-2023a]
MSYSQNGSNSYLNGSYGRETSNGYSGDRHDGSPGPVSRARRAGGYGGFLGDNLSSPSDQYEPSSFRQRALGGLSNGENTRQSPERDGAGYNERRRSKERDGPSLNSARIIQASQNRVRTLRNSVLDAKSNLMTARPELKGMGASSQSYDDMLQILGQIEKLQLVPEQLDARISDKHFLLAVDLLQDALRIIRRSDMEAIGALADLRIYFSNQETVRHYASLLGATLTPE